MKKDRTLGGVEVTEKWLGEIGGWKAFQEARRLQGSGAVTGVTVRERVLSGSVIEGRRTWRCGFVVRGRSEVENLCGCPVARGSGAMCAHSLAAALAWLREEGGGGGAPAVPAKMRAAERRDSELPAAFAVSLSPRPGPGLLRGTLHVEIRAASEEETAADRGLRQWLAAAGVEECPARLALDGERLGSGLRALAGHPRITREGKPVAVSGIPARLTLGLAEAEGGAVAMAVRLEDPSAVLAPPQPGVEAWIFLEDRDRFLPLPQPAGMEPEETAELLRSAGADGRPLVRSRMWLARRLDVLQDAFHLEGGALTELPVIRPGAPRFLLRLEGSLHHLAARLECRYGVREVVCGAAAAGCFPVEDPARPGSWMERNFPAEKAAAAELARAGFAGPDGSGQWVLRGDRPILRFFGTVLPRWQRDWEVDVGERFAHVTREIGRVRPRLEVVQREGGWLDVDIGYAAAGGEPIPRAEILRLLQSGGPGGRTARGKAWALDAEACEELEEVLRDARPEQRSGLFRFAAEQEGFLRAAVEGAEVQVPEAPAAAVAPWVGDLWPLLRDYQRHGVAWMAGRSAARLGGVLADEMGLGKTVQVLAFLRYLQAAGNGGAALVVCPTSLLANWEREAARFAPELACRIYHGAGRTLRREEGLVLTTYGILAQQEAALLGAEWAAAVLDEATVIRNPDTQAARGARRLRAGLRWALTGTPMENSVRDLWSLMEFVHPGYLGPRPEFRERYEVPLSADPPAEAVATRLRHRLSPFLLRRTKREVARELPERIEQVLPCALTPLQQDLYTAMLREGRERLSGPETGDGASRMVMLTALLRLRQVCCDPRLLGVEALAGRLPADPLVASAKLAALDSLLEEAVEGGHRVLVFSQFVGVLRLVAEHLSRRKWSFCYLDGQTQDRGAVVRRFQESAEIPVFLISLKAGGYGLNLTAADTVVLFDPWWNPAVEAQAADRAHRIGQDRVVTVYKLICRDTVEEKILRLQRRKRGLIDVALDDDRPLMGGLRDEDLRELLR